MFAKRLETLLLASPLLRSIWDRWDQVQLADGWLAAGCLARTVWNDRFGFPPAHGIADLDLIYFDPSDLTETTEAQHARRLQDAFADVPVRLDVKNEARVHLWYERKFGYPIAPYASARDAIASFPTTATALGIRPMGGGMEIHAPFGLDDFLNGVARANKTQIRREIYAAKLARWRVHWPGLQVVEWDADRAGGFERWA